ncbi:hypothetical protein J45TS6_26680 [Paenibacillus sp. J45TS6]|uniref:hypothetical protein n=1 Tax=Paenibacillus sp. J45TS6 TaxID=2807196 RepID=UPI001B1DF2AD|nr:hypothetical protein [Paenibacillus sp. J45TS6]GIP44209.1 hypothetical protein J45TS6_26680 [Paenibacillus sp. J45TS6]
MLLHSLRYAEKKGYTVCLVLQNGNTYVGEIDINNDTKNLVITCDQGKIPVLLDHIKHASTIVSAHF